jgi:hypothetical protein
MGFRNIEALIIMAATPEEFRDALSEIKTQELLSLLSHEKADAFRRALECERALATSRRSAGAVLVELMEEPS